MKDLKEEVVTEAGKETNEPDEMGWTHGQNERRNNDKKMRDCERRRLQHTRKTPAKMGGLSAQRRYEKHRKKKSEGKRPATQREREI